MRTTDGLFPRRILRLDECPEPAIFPAIPRQNGDLMALEDADARQGRIEKAYEGIERLQTKLQGQRCRLRIRERVEETAEEILKQCGAERWVRVEIAERKDPVAGELIIR